MLNFQNVTGFSNEGLRLLPKAKDLAQVGRRATVHDYSLSLKR